jgi:hypothetical protein
MRFEQFRPAFIDIDRRLQHGRGLLREGHLIELRNCAAQTRSSLLE